MINCIIAGVGGQGTVLMSRLIGSTAITKGYDLRGAETIGMAQRGGSVVSHVRIGEDIHAPLIPPAKADIVIAFEPGEAVRAFRYLAPGGTMVVCDRAIRPVTSSLGRGSYAGGEMLAFLRTQVRHLVVIDGDTLIDRCGAKAMNVALLGVAVGCGLFPFTAEDVAGTIEARVPPHFVSMNKHALATGLALAKERSLHP